MPSASFALLALTLACAPLSQAALAIKLGHSKVTLGGHITGLLGANKQKTCKVATAQLALPTEGDVSMEPGYVPKYIGLGIGNLEWVCGDDAKTWELTSQKASIFDISCTYNKTTVNGTATWFNDLTALAATLHNVDGESALTAALNHLTGLSLTQLGELYTSTDASNTNNTDITFDFTTAHDGVLKGVNGSVTTALKSQQPAPVASYNIDWAEFKAVTGSGHLADVVYQVQTAGGIVSTNGLACSPGAKESVPYTSQYWFLTSPVQANTTITTKNCPIPKITAAKRSMAVLSMAVEYGQQDQTCTTVDDCSTKCLADTNCQGFSISVEDGEGYTKTSITSAGLIYAPAFTSGIVHSITNKQFITRQGTVSDCPAGQVTAAGNLGCVLPTC